MPEDSPPATFQTTDSSGVIIAESTDPLWTEGGGWIVSAEPQVVIGQVEGDERYLLNEVRGVRRLSDGRIAILDAGSRRVRLYDSAGTHLMDLGGEGDGPGEFRTPQFLGVAGDTLFVYEAIGGPLTWYSPDGNLLRTSSGFSQAQREHGTLHMIGTLGAHLALGVRHGAAGYQVLPTGILREPISVWRIGLMDSEDDSLFSVPGYEVEIVSSDGRGTLQRRYVFGKWTGLAASNRRVYVAPTDEYSIRVHDEVGRLLTVIRRDLPPRRVTRRDLNRWVEEYLEILDLPQEEREEMGRTSRELKIAETMPAFRWMTVDSEDNLWVEEWKGVGLAQGSFSVFRPDGAWLGNVDVPEGLPWDWGDHLQQLMEIGSDYLLGVWKNAYGVEQVRMYGIEKG
ncbi:hypothetical protein ACFL5A_04670 [Gemmatimonadota bacterium]